MHTYTRLCHEISAVSRDNSIHIPDVNLMAVRNGSATSLRNNLRTYTVAAVMCIRVCFNASCPVVYMQVSPTHRCHIRIHMSRLSSTSRGMPTCTTMPHLPIHMQFAQPVFKRDNGCLLFSLLRW